MPVTFHRCRPGGCHGNCYEIYGFDKDGNRAEVYFDTRTLAIVKSEIRKKK